MSESTLRNRFAVVNGMWDEYLRSAGKPKTLGDGTPLEKIERFELAFVDELFKRANPGNTDQIAGTMWDLVENRPADDPVKVRVTAHHEALARMAARRL